MFINQADNSGDETEISEKTDASDAGTPEDASNNVQKSQAQSTSGKAKGRKKKAGTNANEVEEPQADESSGSTADQGGR